MNSFFSLEFRYFIKNIAISRPLIAKRTSDSSVNWYEKPFEPTLQHDFDPKREIKCYNKFAAFGLMSWEGWEFKD